jgi:hypothetical protein
MSNLQLLINEHLTNGRFEELGPDYYVCGCGSFFKRCNVRAHLRTNKHANYIERSPLEEGEIIENPEDCTICYESKLTFWQCTTCIHKICTNCSERCEKCPYCRTPIPGHEDVDNGSDEEMHTLEDELEEIWNSVDQLQMFTRDHNQSINELNDTIELLVAENHQLRQMFTGMNLHYLDQIRILARDITELRMRS